MVVADTADACAAGRRPATALTTYPRDDVRRRPSGPDRPRGRRCPFKGDASYWTLELDGATHENIVWSYADPIPEMREIEGLLCFFNERVTLHVRDELS